MALVDPSCATREAMLGYVEATMPQGECMMWDKLIEVLESEVATARRSRKNAKEYGDDEEYENASGYVDGLTFALSYAKNGKNGVIK